MLENLFSVVLGKLKHKSSSSKSSQHDSTGSSSVVTTTTSSSGGIGGRSSDGSSSHISRPYSLPTPPPPLRHHPCTIANYGGPPQLSNANHQNSRKENELANIYMLPNLGPAGGGGGGCDDNNRQTPLSTGMLATRRDPQHNTTMDDMMNYGTASRTVASASNLDPFKRSTKTRMSLPVMSNGRGPTRTLLSQGNRSNTLAKQRAVARHSHQQQHSMGHIYLQHRGETKQAHLPNELTAIDTIWALFVCAFPQWLTMEYMSLAHVKIYIYNPSCNIFYELQDIEEVKHESILRIHQSDPILALGPPAPHMPLAQLQYQQHQHMQRLATQQHIHAPPKPRRMIPSTPTLESQSIYGIATPTLHNGHPKNILNHQQMSNSNLRYQPQQHLAPYQQQPMSQTFHLPSQQQMNPASNHQWSSSSPFVNGGQHQHQIQLPPHWQTSANMSPNSQACLRLPDGI